MVINRSCSKTAWLEKIINFAKPYRLKIPNITVKNCADPYSAEFHYGGYEEPFIILRLGSYKEFPLFFKLSDKKIKKTGYFGEYYLPNKTCAAIFTIAHELRHYQQYLDPKKKFWLYHDKKLAETDADNFAFRKLNRYLKLKEDGLDPLK